MSVEQTVTQVVVLELDMSLVHDKHSDVRDVFLESMEHGSTFGSLLKDSSVAVVPDVFSFFSVLTSICSKIEGDCWTSVVGVSFKSVLPVPGFFVSLVLHRVTGASSGDIFLGLLPRVLVIPALASVSLVSLTVFVCSIDDKAFLPKTIKM